MPFSTKFLLKSGFWAPFLTHNVLNGAIFLWISPLYILNITPGTYFSLWTDILSEKRIKCTILPSFHENNGFWLFLRSQKRANEAHCLCLYCLFSWKLVLWIQNNLPEHMFTYYASKSCRTIMIKRVWPLFWLKKRSIMVQCCKKLM